MFINVFIFHNEIFYMNDINVYAIYIYLFIFNIILFNVFYINFSYILNKKF